MGPLESVCVLLTKLRDNSCKNYTNFVAIAAPSCVAILLSSAFACICFLFTHTSISVSVYTMPDPRSTHTPLPEGGPGEPPVHPLDPLGGNAPTATHSTAASVA